MTTHEFARELLGYPDVLLLVKKGDHRGSYYDPDVVTFMDDKWDNEDSGMKNDGGKVVIIVGD